MLFIPVALFAAYAVKVWEKNKEDTLVLKCEGYSCLSPFPSPLTPFVPSLSPFLLFPFPSGSSHQSS